MKENVISVVCIFKGQFLKEQVNISLKSSYGNLGNLTTYAIIIAETESSFGIVFQYYPTESKDTKWKYMAELNFYTDEKNSEYYKIVVAYFGTDKTGKTPPTQRAPDWWESPRFQAVCAA